MDASMTVGEFRRWLDQQQSINRIDDNTTMVVQNNRREDVTDISDLQVTTDNGFRAVEIRIIEP